MGKTIAEKIFTAHLRDTPSPGNAVLDIDVVLCHEITTPIAINDLVAQGKLIRADRVQVTGNGRQSDQAGNLRVQIANHNARVKTAGGEPEMIVRIESPQVAVYGDTAVVSFLRLFNVIPYNSDPVPQNRAWFTLVLVKERGSWGIAHSHVSQAN